MISIYFLSNYFHYKFILTLNTKLIFSRNLFISRKILGDIIVKFSKHFIVKKKLVRAIIIKLYMFSYLFIRK